MLTDRWADIPPDMSKLNLLLAILRMPLIMSGFTPPVLIYIYILVTFRQTSFVFFLKDLKG